MRKKAERQINVNKLTHFYKRDNIVRKRQCNYTKRRCILFQYFISQKRDQRVILIVIILIHFQTSELLRR